jgi:hypothetical protein
MPRDEEAQTGHVGSDGKTWAEWKRELSEAIEELDKACANARQVIYRLRPLVRPKQQRKRGEDQGEEQRPVHAQERRGRDGGARQ